MWPTLATHHHSSYWPNEQAGCNNKSLQGFLNNREEFFLVILQLCTLLVIHTLDFFTQLKMYFSIQNWIWKFWSSGWFYVSNWSPFYFVAIVRVIGKVSRTFYNYSTHNSSNSSSDWLKAFRDRANWSLAPNFLTLRITFVYSNC